MSAAIGPAIGICYLGECFMGCIGCVDGCTDGCIQFNSHLWNPTPINRCVLIRCCICPACSLLTFYHFGYHLGYGCRRALKRSGSGYVVQPPVQVFEADEDSDDIGDYVNLSM